MSRYIAYGRGTNRLFILSLCCGFNSHIFHLDAELVQVHLKDQKDCIEPKASSSIKATLKPKDIDVFY